MDLWVDRVRFPDGSEGELEVVRHSGAAAVVPCFPPDRRAGRSSATVVLLRQYRYAAGGRLWEIPAGTLEEGETPEECARRELREEAGLQAGELRFLTRVLPSPGFTDEEIRLYLAVDPDPAEAAPDADEFLERREVEVGEALAMVERGEIVDAKSACALLYAARFAGLEGGAEGSAPGS